MQYGFLDIRPPIVDGKIKGMISEGGSMSDTRPWTSEGGSGA